MDRTYIDMLAAHIDRSRVYPFSRSSGRTDIPGWRRPGAGSCSRAGSISWSGAARR